VARRLGLSHGVQTGLLDIFEWWKGNGRPMRLRGDDVSPVARIVNVAGVAALFDRSPARRREPAPPGRCIAGERDIGSRP